MASPEQFIREFGEEKAREVVEMDKYKAIAEKITYSLDGYIADHNNRNFGDADLWLRHVRNRWEQFIEAHPDSYNFHEYLQHQQAKVDGVQEEFAEDERFLKEQIQQKDLKISNLEYQQGMDKELIQTLQGRSAALQDRVNELQKRVDSVKQLIQDYLDEEKELELKEWEQSTIYGRIAIELGQALKGDHNVSK